VEQNVVDDGIADQWRIYVSMPAFESQDIVHIHVTQFSQNFTNCKLI